MKTLRLFNAVFKDEESAALGKVHVDYMNGAILAPGAVSQKTQILNFYANERLNGRQLNSTFYDSWTKVLNYTRLEILIDQIAHYASTYGTDFEGRMYIPHEVYKNRSIPAKLNLEFVCVSALTQDQMAEKCVNMLNSGIALKDETIHDLLDILIECEYPLNELRDCRNKEASIILADQYGILPTKPVDFLRLLVFKATGQSLLIKNRDTIQAIKNSSFNASLFIKNFGEENLAPIFNRFKPLFLAFKNNRTRKSINKISKLSKKLHMPMPQNPLNLVTSRLLVEEDLHWLENATTYSIFKAMSALYNRIKGQDTFVYKIRNGKSFAKAQSVKSGLFERNFILLVNYLRNTYDFSEHTFYIPEGVEYALPTSEKLYVGNIPMGTKFTGDKMCAGIYWENSWGARDLDLSGLNIAGKIGWNSTWNQSGGSLMYSGDITNAPNGAVEYLRANNGLKHPTLVVNNVYSGDSQSQYKIVVGCGNHVDESYMMDPNKVMAEVVCNSVQKHTVLGMMLPNDENGKQSFVIMNIGAGNARVSGTGEVSNLYTKALYQEYKKPITLNEMLSVLGATVVTELPTDVEVVDLSPNKLERDTLMNLFSEQDS